MVDFDNIADASSLQVLLMRNITLNTVFDKFTEYEFNNHS